MTAWRVLIVTGDPDRGAGLRQRVEGLGHRVTAVVPADDVLTLVASTTPDLLLVDAPEPGDAAAALVESIYRRVPTPAVLSAPASTASALDCVSGGGFYGCIDEEADDDALRLAIERALISGVEYQATQGLDAFFELSLDMFAFLDFRGYFLRLNKAWEQTLGYSTAELMDRPFIVHVHPEDRERTLARNGTVRLGSSARHFENRYLHKDGSPRWLVWNATPNREHGVIYAVARDITAQRAAEEERAQLRGDLAKSRDEVKTLQEILPICSYCRRIRDDKNYWHSVESYIVQYTGSRFSHGVCPSCVEQVEEPLAAEDTPQRTE